ncbi:acetyl-CoA carboxylase biotin carboxylase subunit [Arenibacter sp. BSSL-BM3]|uniref:Acetyl-CoA carboxylase biotin carboxylase subunit n=1 Tax=Arenibacter arenosicollis TaxID=2762274 RepID=A0ABR7QRH3_9FLAO|nr:acetyl-CoA carboxylase biotin carboxylase subunit [Arenibacter arenosicollis]MBC8769791.1 acetyl-CoA carboxylase biotin carboxylase subunit [Arenibacter arenosicollis]
MKKILVANRGEIALRIMRTAQKMGIKTVAVYSVADREAPHVRFANEAVHLGNSPSSESYLDMDKIVNAALQTKAEGIHPGYGFLSENAAFAQLVTKNGLSFIGPKPHAIEVMGDKLAAKEAVKAYNIPMIPGIEEAITDIALAQKISKKIGFPVLIKASAGGGGKGMRVVHQLSELPEQMERAISEAKAAFGNGSVFLEKYIESPRHIEIQVLADTHGNILHLFERECSIQRRHQKVVEEAPSAILTPEIRKAMGEAAVKVAKACDYVGAGTVEFLLDGDNKFYFLEMNTRLQVEHPVTELITGIDLVEQQIKIARNEKLAFSQEDLSIKGHALEVRVYAEDPLNNFLPSMGTLETYKRPEGEGVRLDDGFEEGMTIPMYYDPMLAKLITYGKNREEAIQLMIRAISDFKIKGISTTLPFGKFVCEHEAFTSGNFDTHFVKNYFKPELLHQQYGQERKIAALVGLKLFLEHQEQLKLPDNQNSDWSLKRTKR